MRAAWKPIKPGPAPIGIVASDAAVTGVAVQQPTLAPFAREGVLHR